MRRANSEVVASAICGFVLLAIGVIGTAAAILSLFPGARPFLHVSEFRVDYMIIGPMVIILATGILADIFKHDGSKVKKSIR